MSPDGSYAPCPTREGLRGLTRPLGRPTTSKGIGVSSPVCALVLVTLQGVERMLGNAGNVERRSPWCVPGPPASEAVMLGHSAVGTSSVGFGRNTRTKREPQWSQSRSWTTERRPWGS